MKIFFETHSVYVYRLHDLSFGDWIECGNNFCYYSERQMWTDNMFDELGFN